MDVSVLGYIAYHPYGTSRMCAAVLVQYKSVLVWHTTVHTYSRYIGTVGCWMVVGCMVGLLY